MKSYSLQNDLEFKKNLIKSKMNRANKMIEFIKEGGDYLTYLEGYLTGISEALLIVENNLIERKINE